MPTFLTTFLLFAALLGALGLPLWWVAYRAGDVRTIRNYTIGVLVIALVSGLMARTSELQVAQCVAAGNPACVDYGTTGSQVVLVVFFVVGAWWSAYSIWRG